MQALFKIMLALATIFVLFFVILNSTGILSLEKIQIWLENAKQLSPIYVASLVIGLLLVDLIISVPTLALTLLSGFFLGAAAGAATAIVGLVLSGSTGYWLSYRFGERYVNLVLRDPNEQAQARESFQQHGSTIIFLSRAIPMLPEISACMAGVTRMPYHKFILLWLVSCVPYCIIASYAGSISTVDDPTPAIIGAIGLMTILWLGWLFFNRKTRKCKYSKNGGI